MYPNKKCRPTKRFEADAQKDARGSSAGRSAAETQGEQW